MDNRRPSCVDLGDDLWIESATRTGPMALTGRFGHAQGVDDKYFRPTNPLVVGLDTWHGVSPTKTH